MIVESYPLRSKETDLGKTTDAGSRSFAGPLALGVNLGAKLIVSAAKISGVERNTSRWIVTPLTDREAGVAVPGLSAVWKYAHNDLFTDRVQSWIFNHDLHPGAMFGFETEKTEVEFEVTLLWSSDRSSRDSQGKRKIYYPIQFPWAKGSKPIFFNFVYQVNVLVDLEKIPDHGSWFLPDMKTLN